MIEEIAENGIANSAEQGNNFIIEKLCIWDELDLYDTNVDVNIVFKDGTRYFATFFTYKNIITLQEKNKRTGECLNGQFFWATNMCLIEKIDLDLMREVVLSMIDDGAFQQAFYKITSPKLGSKF